MTSLSVSHGRHVGSVDGREILTSALHNNRSMLALRADLRSQGPAQNMPQGPYNLGFALISGREEIFWSATLDFRGCSPIEKLV